MIAGLRSAAAQAPGRPVGSEVPQTGNAGHRALLRKPPKFRPRVWLTIAALSRLRPGIRSPRHPSHRRQGDRTDLPLAGLMDLQTCIR